MYKYIISITIIILIIVSLSFSKDIETEPSLSYTDIPQNMQLYARDGQDSSYVIFEGQVETEGYDSIYVEVYKNGTSYDRLSNEYGSVYNGAFIRNNRGLAMLSFDDVFINEFK